MKAIGIKKTIDEIGRVVIPVDVRRAVNLGKGDEVLVFVNNDNEVVLKPITNAAVNRVVSK